MNKDKKTEGIRHEFLMGIDAKAREFANDEKSITVLEHHMIAAIIHEMANVYAFNVHVLEELGNLKADIESIRRAIGNKE